MKRLRVGVLYGGRSGEHEVSLASAAAVFANLDRNRYEPVPIRIDKDGRWAIADRPPTTMSAGDVIEHARVEGARSTRGAREVHLVARPSEETILSIDRGAPAKHAEGGQVMVTGLNLDVIFPVLHGPYGEDGTVQGLLASYGIPYVGADVASSAIGIDKRQMKHVFAARGLPQVAHRPVRRSDWERDRDAVVTEIESSLRYPLFTKPARQGSSIGIRKCTNAQELREGIVEAFGYDRVAIVEQGLVGIRELECGVIGNS